MIRAQANIRINIRLTIIQILKQTTNYSFAVLIDKLNKILTNHLVQVSIFTNFKTAHSHYNSSSSHHSTKSIVILSESIAILPLFLVKRIFGIFV